MLSMHIGGKCKELMDGRKARWMQRDNTSTCSTFKQSHICKISAQYLKTRRRKVQKTAHFLYSEFTKRHNSFKN